MSGPLDGHKMIDREARDQLAEQLRRLIGGLITNDEFEIRIRHSADRAVHEIYLEAWGTYDDLHEHKLQGKYKLTPEAKEFMARCILFLKTDQPWPWPSRKSVFWIGIGAL